MRMAVAIWLVCAGVVACDRRPGTEDNVRQALEQANIQTVQVEVDDKSNVVHLQGIVGTMSDRTRADEIAGAIVGTNGRVLNELTVERLTDGPDATDPDQLLHETLDARLDANPVIRERDVIIDVTDAVVTITGEVKSAEEKQLVHRLVMAVPGVKGVENALQVNADH